MQKVNLLLGFVLFCAAVVEGQPPIRPRTRSGTASRSCTLNFKNDINSMFYWPGYENICSRSLCDTYRWLKCDVAKQYILEQAMGHGPEDILMEIEYIKNYFNTLIPQPKNILDYSCKGVCHEQAKTLQLERLFANVPTMNPHTYGMEEKRLMCIVIGPDIFYQRCGGKCKLPFGDSGDSYCVPDVVVNIDIWVFCPDAKPNKCHKVKFDLPLSCSCKKFRCKKNVPAIPGVSPALPLKPIDWDPNNPGYPTEPDFFAKHNILADPSVVGPSPHHGSILLGDPHGPMQLGPVDLGPAGGQHIPLHALGPHGAGK